MTKDQVREFQQAIGKASWNMDLWTFATALGSDADHDYTKKKFREFQELNKSLSRFDSDTLARILNHATS